ncbi:DEAD box helicase,putative [Plasmodium sp. DRC-Itaito]|nr:DEAD box helicase,putative [Plasmodium sp. DRC-Itaito]
MAEQFNEEIRRFFPFEPYKIQLNFMRLFYQVLTSSNIKKYDNLNLIYEVIKQNQNIQDMLKDDACNLICDHLNIFKNEDIKNTEEEHIICEMKTGSGKSLTLLTSLIYWLWKHQINLFFIKENIELKSTEPEWIKESVIKKVIEKYKHNIQQDHKIKENNLNILKKYFSFTDDKIVFHKNIKITKKKCEQHEAVEKNDNFVLPDNNDEVPSDYSIDDKDKKKQIFICSRTQSQLNQYFHELKKIEKKMGKEFSINMIIIGSRKHLCINEDFLKKYKNINELNDCCKNSKCKYKEIYKEKFTEKCKKKHEKKKKIFYDSSSSSNYSENEDIEKINNYSLITKLINSRNIDIEDIKDICKNEHIEICPYYLSKENIKNADIILLPYICILNENIRNNLKINIKNNIVIFDESQNIIENINSCNSLSISNHHIFFCKLILDEYIKKYKHVLNNNNIIMIKQIIVYCNLLLESFTCVEQNLININKYTLLSKLDVLNLNNISNFLNNSQFCRKIKIFTESLISKYFKNIKKYVHAPFSVFKTSAIYILNEFTQKLIKSNLYDYVCIHHNDNYSLGIRHSENNYMNRINHSTHTMNDKNCKDENIIFSTSCDIDKIKNKKRIITSHVPTLVDIKKNKLQGGNHKIKQLLFVNDNNNNNCDNNNNNNNNCDNNCDNNYHNNKLPIDDTYNNLKIFFEELFVRKRKDLFKEIEVISVSSCSNFQKIIKHCSNVILIGGTLYPIEEFLLLFLSDNKNKIKFFSSDYIFKKENIFARIFSTNIITSDFIDNTYKNRLKNDHLLNLAIYIYIITFNVLYGNIIFFPSYNFLNDFYNFLNKEGEYIFNKIKKKKFVFFEKKNDDMLIKNYINNIENIKNIDANLRIQNGCILFCVMNGKLSEGINFYDDLCRNIIVVGIPFVKHDNIVDKNLLRLKYYREYTKDTMNTNDKNDSTKILIYDDVNKMCETYEIKYAMKIINQCIGRSLRHINDFSSFFFLDYRFSKKEIFQNLPSFIKTHLNDIDNKIYKNYDEKENNYIQIKEHFQDTYANIQNFYTEQLSSCGFNFKPMNEDLISNLVKDLDMLKKFHDTKNK